MDTADFHELLLCSICLDRFIKPKVLPCQHSFCLHCLEDVVKGKKEIECPQCRKVHGVPENGADGFQDNLMAKGFLERMGVIANCFDCRGKLNLTKCKHCNEDVCTDCRVRHAEIMTEIRLFLKSLDGSSDEQAAEHWKDMLKKVVQEKAKVPEEIELKKKEITKTGEEIITFMDALEGRILQLAKEQGHNFTQIVLEKLEGCKTTTALNNMKHALYGTQKLVEIIGPGNKELKVDFGLQGRPMTAKIVCGNVEVEVTSGDNEQDDLPQGSVMGAMGDVPRSLSLASLSSSASTGTDAHSRKDCSLPKNVNYEAKNASFKSYLDRHVQIGKKLSPTKAIYSPVDKSVYCISEGTIVVYPMDASQGRILSPEITNVRDIALNDLGKLVIIQGKSVNIIAIHHGPGGCSLLRFIQMIDIAKNAEQIQCHGNEFVITDAVKKCLKVFNEDGQLVREFGSERLNKYSRFTLTVDDDGRIYVYASSDLKIQDCGRLVNGRCTAGAKLSSKEAILSYSILVFAWTGEFVEEFNTDTNWTQRYDYKFDGPKCGGVDGHNLRNEKSVPTDDQIRAEYPPIAMCVDGEGHVSVSFGDQIDVFDPKRELRCIIGDPKNRPGEFKDLLGLSLMPDGRMLVCDTGNNRIQII